MSSIEIYWPSYLKPIKIINKTGTWGISKAKYNTGVEIVRSYQDKELATLAFSVYLDPQLTENYNKSLRFLHYICGSLNPFWFHFPHPTQQLDVIVGVGDGVKTTFVAPMVVDSPGVLYPTVSGIPPASYTVHDDGPNVLTALESEAEESLFTTTGVGTKSSDPAVSVSFPFSIGDAMKMNTAAATFLALSPIGVIPAVPGDLFTAVLIASADSASLHTARVRLAYYDAGLGITGTFVTNIALDETGRRFIITVSGVAPALTVWAGWRGGVDATGSGDEFIHGAGISHGDLDQLWHGADALPVIEFGTAPADGAIIRARAPSASPVLYMRADSVGANLNAIGAREVKVKIREIIHA